MFSSLVNTLFKTLFQPLISTQEETDLEVFNRISADGNNRITAENDNRII